MTGPLPTPPPPPGPRGDGDAWVECACGRRHWGRYGAAGLLLHDPAAAGGRGAVLLQHRALWSHEGGTWGVPGGARGRAESALAAAVREANEEAGVAADAAAPRGELRTDHGTWSYTTVLAAVRRRVLAAATDAESLELRWVAVPEVTALALHSGFAAAWPVLRPALAAPELAVVVDGANVVGARPDGWWRDRAGAARRLRDELGVLQRRPLPTAALPEELRGGSTRSGLDWWYAAPLLVVEGAARAVPDDPAGAPVLRAAGSGDDAIVAAVRERVAAGADVVAVTADRELRARVEEAGAAVFGPRWLRDRLDAPAGARDAPTGA